MAALSREVFISRVFAGAPLGTVFAAGSSVVDGLATASVDTSNYEGAMFIQSVVHSGTSGTITFSVRSGSTAVVDRSGSGQGNALTGASAVAAGSSATPEALVIDIYKPRRTGTANFLFGQLVITSSCAMVGPGFCIQYGPRSMGNSTASGTIPQTTASANGITGGVTYLTSPST